MASTRCCANLHGALVHVGRAAWPVCVQQCHQGDGMMGMLIIRGHNDPGGYHCDEIRYDDDDDDDDDDGSSTNLAP